MIFSIFSLILLIPQSYAQRIFHSDFETLDTNLVCGELSSGTISLAGQRDSFSFDALANDQILVTVAGTSDWGGASGANDARFTLFSSTNTPIIDRFASASLFDSNAQIQYQLPADDTYTVKVQANDLVSSGSYNIGITCLLPQKTAAIRLNCNSPLSSYTLEQAGEVDLFRFFAQANDRISITLLAI